MELNILLTFEQFEDNEIKSQIKIISLIKLRNILKRYLMTHILSILAYKKFPSNQVFITIQFQRKN